MMRWKRVLVVLLGLPVLVLAAGGGAAAAAGAAEAAPPDRGERGWIEVTHITFDHDGSEALPLRVDYTATIPKPEWVAGVRSGAALFVQRAPVVILARFTAPSGVDRAWIGASGGPLGGVVGQWVDFTNGISDPEFYSFSTRFSAPAGLGVHTWTFAWHAATIGPHGVAVRPINSSGEHTLYTVLAEPGRPWQIGVSSTQNPWTDALDLILPHTSAATPEEALNDVTAFCFDLPSFEYDIWSGAPCYIEGNWKFNLTLYISDVLGGVDPRVGCCYDGGAIVHTFGGLLGAQTHFVLSGSPYTSHTFGYLNCIDPIGRGEDYSNNPFHESWSYRDDPVCYQDGTSSSCGRSRFGNHAFAGTEVGSSGVIWDGTMCVDVDANPDTPVAYPPAAGYVSSNLTATTLTDANANWTPGQWAGMLLNPNTNKTTPDPYKEYVIVDNTATTIVVQVGSNMLLYAAAGDNYWIRDPLDPDVNIVRLSGYPWFDYEALVVDPLSAEADPPVERTMTLF